MGDDNLLPPPVEDLTKENNEKNFSGKDLENDNLEARIEEEVKLIMKIFPLLQLEKIKGMLTKLGNLPKRSRTVLRQLSIGSEFTEQPPITTMHKSTVPSSSRLIEVSHYSQPRTVKELNFNCRFAQMKKMLPNADPDYLRIQLESFKNNLNSFTVFVNNALKYHNYPKKASSTRISSNKLLQSQFKNNANFGKKPIRNCSSPVNSSIFLPKSTSQQKRPVTQSKKRKQNNLSDLFCRPMGNARVPYAHTSQPNNLENSAQNHRGGIQATSAQLNPNYSKSYVNKTEAISKTQPKEDPILYTTKFSVENFLERIPDPVTYFRENRHNKPWGVLCEHYATCALYNIYNQINIDKIKECISIAPNFLAACDMLDRVPQPKGKLRPNLGMPHLINDIPLLKEIAYKIHYAEIMQFTNTQKEFSRLRIAEAKETGLSHNCDCCYDEEVPPEDVFKCEENCCFCRECIRTSVEMSASNGQVTFECLNNCRAQFSQNTLQRALPEKLFAKIMNKKQQEDLECCPFCDFASTPGTAGNVFNCLNPACMKESCRMCKAPNHIPNPCEEVEQDENVMARTYIENKMTEAVLRECYECKTKFVKSDGCNTIMCPCGAQMCYICRKPATDFYLHRGCQKHSVVKVDEESVMKAALEARKEVFSILKIDPIIGMKRYFDELRKINLQLKKEEESINFPDDENEHVNDFRQHSKRKKVDTTTNAGASSSKSSAPLPIRTRRMKIL